MPNLLPTAIRKMKPKSAERKILVVDDEASFTRLVKINLEATG